MTHNILFALFYGLSGILLILLGFAIFRDNPAERLNRITSLMLGWGGIGAFFGALHLLLTQYNLVVSFIEVQNYTDLAKSIWEFFFPQLLLFALIFPNEHPVLRAKKWISVVIFIPHIFHFLIILMAPQLVLEDLSTFVQGTLPLTLAQLLIIIFKLIAFIFLLHKYLFSSINLFYIVLSLILLYKQFKKASQQHLRQQIRFMFVGISFAAGLYTAVISLPVLIDLEIPPIIRSGTISIGLLVGSGSIAVAIIRYRFLDISLLIRKSVFYSFSAGIVGGIYLFIIRYLNQLTGNLFGENIPVFEISFFIFALILFQPLMTRLEYFIDVIFLKGGKDYRIAIQEFSRDIVTYLDFDQLKEQVIEKLSSIMVVDQIILFLYNEHSKKFIPVAWNKKLAQWLTFEADHILIHQLKEIENPILAKNIILLLPEDHAKKIVMEQLHALQSFILVPITYRGRLSGFISLDEKITQSRYSFEDLTLLTVLGGQLAVALENIRLYHELADRERAKKEMEIAQRIQQNLLPLKNPTYPGMQISSISIPAIEVGGDYFDFFTLPAKKLGVVIGDVAGKGVFGAVYMAMVRSLLRAYAFQIESPKETLLKVNELIRRDTDRHLFVSLFYGILDLSTRELCYVRAGHNLPLLLRASKKECEDLAGKGIALGLSDSKLFEASLDEVTTFLNPNDILLLYTDGITEAMNAQDEEFGETRLVQLLKENTHLSAEAIMQKILSDIQDFVGDATQHDDMTMITLKIYDSK